MRVLIERYKKKTLVILKVKMNFIIFLLKKITLELESQLF